MKIKLIILSLISLFAQPVIAAQSDIPSSCPSIAAIKNIGVNSASYSPGLFWYASNLTPNNYGTNVEWQLIMGLVSDKKYENEAEVIAKLNKSIFLLLLQDGPTHTKQINGMWEWECKYQGIINEKEAVIASTMTPPISVNSSTLVARLKR